VGLINRQGYPCRLLRSGLRPLGFLNRLPQDTVAAISDLGMLPKHELPDLLALADVFVQPGGIDPFEDLRLPGKVPEFLAMARPVVMPDVNIAHLFRDGLDAVLLRTGSAEEIAAKCVDLFSDPQRAGSIGRAGRLLAEKYFDVRSQARLLEDVYNTACGNFNPVVASEVWRDKDGLPSVTLLLARKLKLLADLPDTVAGVEVGELLRTYARYLESIGQRLELIGRRQELLGQRIEGLEAGMADRDEQIAGLTQAAADVRDSISWKVTAPARWASRQIRRAGNQVRRVQRLIDRLVPLWRDPRRIPSTVSRLRSAWGRGGLLAVRRLLFKLPVDVNVNEAWLQYRRTFSPEVEADIRERIAQMQGRPTISVLMVVPDATEWVSRKAIEAVLAQLYSDWELCVAGDVSSGPQVRRMLEEFSAKDGRIRVEFCEFSGGIASAVNRALKMAQWPYVALLEHGAVLEKQALFRLAESILEDDPDMIYSDEALMSEDGEEVVKHDFRPAFSPERLRSHPYIAHLVAFRTDLLRKIGGADATLAISQGYDLILRASEKARRIVHIPEILYLWRQRKSSAGHVTAGEVIQTSRQALARHLDRCGERGEVRDGLMFNYYDVRYPLETGQRVAIIIPTKNHGDLVRQCVESVERTAGEVRYDIVLVDHASDDPQSLEYFRQLGAKHRVLRYEGAFNFSAINNWAVAQLEREYTHYLFCNNDIEATEDGWLERMMELCQKPDVGIVGAKLFYPDRRTLQHAGVCVGMSGIAEHYGKFADNRLPDGSIDPGYHGTLIANHEVSAVTAACALMRRDAFDAVKGFDEALAVGFGDVDLCLRTREAGYRVLFCPHACLTHHESYTRGNTHSDPHPEDSALFKRKWRKILDHGDPYYNPNLDIYSTSWEIKLPMKFNLRIARRVMRMRPVSNA